MSTQNISSLSYLTSASAQSSNAVTEAMSSVPQLTSVTKTISTVYKFAFFNSKLGLVFKIHEGKVILVKVEPDPSGPHEEIIYEDIPSVNGKEILEDVAHELELEEGRVFQNSTIQPYSDDEEEDLQNDQLMKQFKDAGDNDDELASKLSLTPTSSSTSRRPSSAPVAEKKSSDSKKELPSPPPPTVKKLEYSEIAFSSDSYGGSSIQITSSAANSNAFSPSAPPAPLDRMSSMPLAPPPPPPPPGQTGQLNHVGGPPPVPPPPPPVPAPALVTPQKSTAEPPAAPPAPPSSVGSASGETYKILVESDHFFGPTIKKALKFTANSNILENLSLLRDEIKEKFALSVDAQAIIVSYYDEDLTSFVELERDCWNDFIGQTKKHIQLTENPKFAAVTKKVETTPSNPNVPPPTMTPPPPPPPPKPPQPTAPPSMMNDHSSIPLPAMITRTPSTQSANSNKNQQQQQQQQNTYQNLDPFADRLAENSTPIKQNSVVNTPPSMLKRGNSLPPTAAGSNITLSTLSLLFASSRFKIYDVNDNAFQLFLQSFQKYRNCIQEINTFYQQLQQQQQSLVSSSSSTKGIMFCNGKKWLIAKKYPPLGCTIISINGVKINNLDKDFQMALIRQKQRPLILEFEFTQTVVFTMDYTNNNPMITSNGSSHQSIGAIIASTSNLGLSNDQTNNTTTNSLFSPNKTYSSDHPPPSVLSNKNNNSQKQQEIINSNISSMKLSEKKSSTSTENKNIIKFPFFLSKYSTHHASKLRKKVDSIIKDYFECEWIRVKNECKPQQTITSTYSYIENEMIYKLDLFNNKRSRGLGAPDDMNNEETLNSLRDCIEYFIFKKIAVFNKTLFPIFYEPLPITPVEEYDDPPHYIVDPKFNVIPLRANNNPGLNSPNPSGGGGGSGLTYEKTELSHELSLSIKLSFLRFLSLEHLGLNSGSPSNPHHHFHPNHRTPGSNSGGGDGGEGNNNVFNPFAAPTTNSTAMKNYYQTVLSQLSAAHQEMIQSEEWYLAIKGLTRALQMEIPYEILKKLVKVVNLISHALESYIMAKKKNQNSTKVSSSSSYFPNNPSFSGPNSIVCSCGKLHVMNNEGQEATIPDCLLNPKENNNNNNSSLIPVDSLKNISYLKFQSENSSTESGENNETYSISADDLLPAIVWTLIQSNFHDFEYILWLCSEFRHPELLRGEEAYSLAQFTSALEFIRSSNYQSFDIPREIYSLAILQYNYTLKLLLACKNNDVTLLKECIVKGANINALSPDYKDSALTACIQFHSFDCLKYLLFHCNDLIHVDQIIHLFHGPNERCTALFIAIMNDCLESVILLLKAGANRYLQDDQGNTTFKLATERESSLLLTLLLADTNKYDLIHSILHYSDERIIAGLLLQGVNMNGIDTTGYFTPLIATILIESIPMLCLLLTNQCQNMLQLNQMNKNHETALHIAVKLCLLDPNNYRYVILAAILLRNGANRYAKDKFHESPVSILQNIDVNNYHPSQLNENQRNHYYHASCISIYQQMIINENISIPYLENDLFIYEFFEGMNSQNVLGKGGGSSSSGEGNNPADYSRRGSHGSGKRLSNTRGVIENGLSANVFDDRVVNPHDLSRPHEEDNLNNLEDSTKSSAMSSTVNSYQNYALFYMKLLILNDPFPAARDPHHHQQQQQQQQQQQHSKTEEEDLVKAPPIYDLARNKDIYGLKVLLLQGIDINTFSANKGYNPLISAVYNKDYEMIELLLKNTLKIYQLTDFTYQVSNWFRLFHEFFSSIISNKNDYLIHIQKLSSQLSYNKDNLYLKFNLQGKGGMTALHYASQLGDIKIVGLLLQYGAIRDIKNTKGHIPLDIALANGNIDCANALRFDPAKVSICLAAKHGDWLVMKALLSQGISINTIKEHYSKDNPPQLIHELYTPLIAAISHGQLELVKNILDEYSNEINVNQCNLVQQSPLMYASILGDENIVVKLLKMGANRYHADKSDHTSSYYAKEISKNENIYQILINDPAQVFIHDIIRKNEFPGVVAMLKQGIDPNQKRYSSSPSNLSAWISHDTSNGNKNQQLQRSVSNLDQQKRPSSMKKRSSDTNNASNKSNSSNQENDLLKQINGDDNLLYIPGETPLIIACRYNCIEIARLLCKAPNIDINLPDENGNTPLFHAALKGHEEIVLLLIKQKTIQRKFMNKHKQTALDYALIANHLQIAAIIESDPYCVHIHDMCEKGKMLHVVALLKQGCPPNYRDERLGLHSQTPLMAAASGGKTEIIRMLLRYPEVMDGKDDRDSLGRTALMRAAGIGALDCTAILLNAGCDRNLVDNSGMSAKDHASRHSYSVMFQFMSQTMIR